MDVFYATNRSPTPSGFADTAVPGPLSWGVATCTPDSTAPEAFRWELNGCNGLATLPADAWRTRLHAALQQAGSRRKAALVHLHGAGVLSADAFVRAASLARIYAGSDLDIVPILFSWASGTFSVSDYIDARRWLIRDVADLAGAYRTVAQTLGDARTASGGALITVLSAHSLGNFLLGRILADCAARAGAEPDGTDPPFDDVLLLASDVDETALDDTSPPPGLALHRLGRWVRGITVYYSTLHATVGLGWIGQIGLTIPGRSGPALGDGGPQPSIAHLADGTPVDAINCTNLPAAIDGNTQHHYWRIDPLAIRDIDAVIRRAPPSAMPWRTRNLFEHSWTIFPNGPPQSPGSG